MGTINKEEKLNFLKEELKKIEDQIKTIQYNLGVLDSQEKLWKLRDKIMEEIREVENM